MAKFIQEVSLYDDQAIAKRVQQTNTQFEVLNGKIAAVVSEEDLVQLRNGATTVYKKLSSVEQTADGLTQKVTQIEGNYVTQTEWTQENDMIYGEISDNSDDITTIEGTINGWIFGNGSSSTRIDGGSIDTDSITADRIDVSTLIVSGRAYTPSTSTGDRIIRIESASVANADVGNTQIQKGKLAIYGLLPIYNSSGSSIGAYIGYDRGYDGSSTTYGASLQASSGSSNVIVTSSGAAVNGGSATVACYSSTVSLEGGSVVCYGSNTQLRPSNTHSDPDDSSGSTVGSGSYRWKCMYTAGISANYYWSGSAWVKNSTAISSSSDENLKRDVKYESIGYLIDDLKPVVFRRTTDDDDLWHVGLKAGELIETLEKNDLYGYGMVTAANQPDDTVKLAIDYDELTVALISKCQELQKQNNELEQRLTALEEALLNTQ